MREKGADVKEGAWVVGQSFYFTCPLPRVGRGKLAGRRGRSLDWGDCIDGWFERV